MRLEPDEIAAIREAVRAVFGERASARVFGSRVDDRARGGDLDLFVEVKPGQATIEAEAALRDRIEPVLDDLKVDIFLHERSRPLPPIGEIAVRDGIRL
jgi:predicted nucleotidyltransferase